MVNLTSIAALAQNKVIGNKGGLIWHLPDDLKHFQKLTKGHVVIMGRKTYQSMGRPLPHRENFVVTRQADLDAPGCRIFNDLQLAITASAKIDERPFIIGGAEIYRLALPHCAEMELTFIHHPFSGDTLYPEFMADEWEEVWREKHPADRRHPYAFDFVRLRRKAAN